MPRGARMARSGLHPWSRWRRYRADGVPGARCARGGATRAVYAGRCGVGGVTVRRRSSVWPRFISRSASGVCTTMRDLLPRRCVWATKLRTCPCRSHGQPRFGGAGYHGGYDRVGAGEWQRRSFGALFWFAIAGAPGAILYRLGQHARCHVGLPQRPLSSFRLGGGAPR